jgi:hypothetical protein
MRLLAQHIQQRSIYPPAEPREAVNRFPWFTGPNLYHLVLLLTHDSTNGHNPRRTRHTF